MIGLLLFLAGKTKFLKAPDRWGVPKFGFFVYQPACSKRSAGDTARRRFDNGDRNEGQGSLAMDKAEYGMSCKGYGR